MEKTQKNIFDILDQNFPNKWSTKNAFSIDHEAESRQTLFVELQIGERTVIGCSSTNKDFTKDVSEHLLERAVESAYKKMLGKKQNNFTKEQTEKINGIKQRHNIKTKEQWNSYVKVWDKTKTVNDLNKENVNDFINYIEELEKKTMNK